MKKRFVLVGVLLHVLLLLAAYAVQALIFPYLSPTGIRPVLLPLAVAGVAVFEGGTRGALFGLFAGALCDMSFNQPVMALTVLFTLFGLAAGFLSDIVIARGFPSYIVCCAAALALTAFTQMFAFLFFEGLPISALMRTALLQTLYSLVCAVPIYFAVKPLGYRDMNARRPIR
ncbi:MAG: hypothetical protein LBS51_01290 [Oscillospiraceae bacterium]|jgi:hypothetical protein|nr:hypothetical protein [Oscillospiraceae bacterium]